MSEIQTRQVNPQGFEPQSPYKPAPKPDAGVNQVQAAQTVESQSRIGEIQPRRHPSQGMKTKLKFRVDRDSNEVTVLILDAKSHEVIRTVPPEELAELTPGELIDLSR